MGLFSKKKKQEQTEQRSYVPSYWGSSLPFGQYVKHSPMSLSAVFAAIDIISNSIAELPIQIKAKEDDELNGTVLKDHVLHNIFDNMLMSRFNFLKQLVTDMLVAGNAYAYIKRVNGDIKDIIYLSRGSVSVQYDPAVGKLQYLVTSIKGVPSVVQSKDMLHFFKNSHDGIQGVSLFSFANRTLELSDFTEEAAKDYFGSGCSINGILKFNEMTMNVDKEAIRAAWQQVHSGVDGGKGIAIMDYNCDFIPVSQNANESQMIETRSFNVTEVARYFGISPVMLQDLSNSSYSTIEASQLEFVTHTLLPYISLFESEFNRKLSDGTFYVDLDENYLLKSDKQAEANYITSLKNAGIISINEARQMIGLAPVDGADNLMVNFTDVSQNIIGSTDNENEEEQEN